MGQPQPQQPQVPQHLPLAKPRRDTTTNKGTTTNRVLCCTLSYLCQGGLLEHSAARTRRAVCVVHDQDVLLWFVVVLCQGFGWGSVRQVFVGGLLCGTMFHDFVGRYKMNSNRSIPQQIGATCVEMGASYLT